MRMVYVVLRFCGFGLSTFNSLKDVEVLSQVYTYKLSYTLIYDVTKTHWSNA